MGNVSGNSRKMLGFTLLETLVSLAVLALLLGTVYQIFGTSLRNMQYANDYSHAQMLAESKLAELGKGIPVNEGSFEGRFNEKYRWYMNVTPALASGEEVKTYQIDFKVLWDTLQKERSLDIRTFRLSVEGI